MLSLVELLQEIERNDQKVVLPPADVERLVKRFGPTVRSIGTWHKTTDGSVEIPIANIAAAAREIGSRLGEAVEELQSSKDLSDLLTESSAGGRLIESLATLHTKQFQDRVERFQTSADTVEVERIGADLLRELFGS